MKTLIVCSVLLLVCAANLQAQFSDEFNEDALESGWSWLRESPSNWRLGGGALTIWTETGALNGRTFNNVRNMLLQPLSDQQNFKMDTELRFEPYWTLRNAGLVYYIDDDNYIRVSRGIHDGHNDIWMEWEIDGVTYFDYADAPVGTLEDPLLDFRLRLTREGGNQFSASYQIDLGSAGWTSWNSFATETIAFPSTEPRIGLQAANGDGMVATTSPEQANFNYFRYNVGTAVRPLREAAVAFSVVAAHPSPSSAGSVLTMIVTTDRAAALQWRMTDILGREVIAPQSMGYREQGTHNIAVPTSALPPGVYLWQIAAGNARATKRILLTR
ncbi:MAG: T9SS type A sorting domain-containing protein [Bacteroidetes bacterium]|nr:T9SS type A sorting domain-containing protein [Bacteroidota bacterium]